MSDWIKSLIENASYGGVIFLMFLENVFPPIPSELIMPLAGFVSARGELSLVGLIAAGTAGSVAGAILLYYFGRRIGGERLRRWCDVRGHWIGLTRSDLDASDRWFRRYGMKAVLFGRLVPGVRSLVSIPAGMARVDLRPFLFFTTIGSAVWTAALTIAGRLLGERFGHVEEVLGPISTTVVVGIIVALVIRGFRRTRQAART